MPKFRADSITAFFNNFSRTLLLIILGIIATPAHALFTQCPPTGKSPGCSILITLGDGKRANFLAFDVDPTIPPFDGANGALIGVINNSGRKINGMVLSGVPGIRTFNANGSGIGEYSGPEVEFSNSMAKSGTVRFTKDLNDGHSTWFTLKEVSPLQVKALSPFSTDPQVLEKMSEADKKHQLRCVAMHDGNLSALETARNGFLDPLEICMDECGCTRLNMLQMALTRPPKYWNSFVAMTDPSLHGRLNNLRLAHLMKLSPYFESTEDGDGDLAGRLDQIEAHLKNGRFPQENDHFSWHAITKLLDYFPKSTDSPLGFIKGKQVLAQRTRVAQIINERILPVAPATETPQASWLGVINMPEPQASAALETLHRKYGHLFIPADSSPIGTTIAVQAPATLIQTMIRLGLLKSNDDDAWTNAARRARPDILQMLLDTKQIPPASVWSAAIIPMEREGDFRTFDMILDAYRPPLSSSEAIIVLRNLLLVGDKLSEDQKWLRVDRMLNIGVDINRVFSGADVERRQSFYLYSVLRNQPDLAKKLIDRGLSVTVPMPPNGDNLLINYMAVPMRTDPNHITLRLDVIEAMLKQKNIINQYGEKFQTFPLYLAINISTNLAKNLIKLGADVNAKFHHGHTMLMQAAAHGEINIVKFLIDEGADINHIADIGINALAYSQCYENKEIEALLLQRGAKSAGMEMCAKALAEQESSR